MSQHVVRQKHKKCRKKVELRNNAYITFPRTMQFPHTTHSAPGKPIGLSALRPETPRTCHTHDEHTVPQCSAENGFVDLLQVMARKRPGLLTKFWFSGSRLISNPLAFSPAITAALSMRPKPANQSTKSRNCLIHPDSRWWQCRIVRKFLGALWRLRVLYSLGEMPKR